MIDCRCPMCKMLHKMKLDKKLNTIPWFYCKLCIPKIKNKREEVVSEIHFISTSMPTRIGSE